MASRECSYFTDYFLGISEDDAFTYEVTLNVCLLTHKGRHLPFNKNGHLLNMSTLSSGNTYTCLAPYPEPPRKSVIR